MIKKILLILLFFSPVLLTAQETQENNWDEQIKNRNSIWLQAGVGFSQAQVDNKFKRDHLYYLNGGLHFIPNQYKFAVGATTMGEEGLTINCIWAMAGYNIYRPQVDLSINGGLSMTNWRRVSEFTGYSTSKTVDYKPGVIVNIQTLFHMPYILGIGFEITGNYNPNASYIVIDFCIALGYFE